MLLPAAQATDRNRFMDFNPVVQQQNVQRIPKLDAQLPSKLGGQNNAPELVDRTDNFIDTQNKPSPIIGFLGQS
jgi:hypothetical protein